MVKIKILRTHARAEDCRTVHTFHRNQIVDLCDAFAARIIAQKDGEVFTEVVAEEIAEAAEVAEISVEPIAEPEAVEPEIEEEVLEEKALDQAPENQAISSADLENKTIFAEEPAPIIDEKSSSESSLGEKITNKFNQFKKRKK